MKKTILLLVACSLLLAGCGSSSGGSSSQYDIEIGERYFIEEILSINLNASDYIGKTVKFEGIFDYIAWEGGYVYYVYRNGPGCCGDDGQVGFDVVWEGGGTYPDREEWVEVVGSFERHEDYGFPQLRINLTSLNVMSERGLEFVSQ